MEAPQFDVAIIGAGFCGTMVAVNLLRKQPKAKVILFDRSANAGLGLAYGTTDRDHLLNVRAGSMGAYAHDPGHFWNWLQKTPQPSFAPYGEQSFVPRLLYGEYLQQILKDCLNAYPSLICKQADVQGVALKAGQQFEVSTSDNQVFTARNVVLALGNFPPTASSDAMANNLNPYLRSTWDTLAGPGDVLIVGTGLTSMDLVVTLAKTKSAGVLHLLSRHGLLPREHLAPQRYMLKLDGTKLTTALSLLKEIRREIRGTSTPWQNVVDALRPINQKLWTGLSRAEQGRFLRHLRPYWDVHRHRCAPEIMDTYRRLERSSRLHLHHGSVVSEVPYHGGFKVTWRPRGSTREEQLRVRHIVRCTGPHGDLRRLQDALVHYMLRRDLLVPDGLTMGLATVETYAAIDSRGQKIEGLFALGSLLKGLLYESIAVPELRNQAEQLSTILAAKISPEVYP